MDDFLEKCTKISLKLGISAFDEVGQSRLLEQKQLNIDTNILHREGLEFDVDSKNRVWFVAQMWDTLYSLLTTLYSVFT